MDITTNLFVVSSIIIVGLLSQYIFRKLHIPDVLVLISFGAVLSYLGLTGDLNRDSPGLIFLITFSLIYVIFYGALPIRLKALFSTFKYATILSLLNFVVITGLLGIVSRLLGFGWGIALSLGALFCVLDGTIINSVLEIVRLGQRAVAQVQTESAVVDTLVIVFILSILNFAGMGFADVLRSLSSYLFLSFGIGFAAAIIWAFFIRRLHNSSSVPVATMALLVFIYAFAEFVRANGVITVFSFAIILGNISLLGKLFYKEQQAEISAIDFTTRSFFRDISFLIRSFLFVYLGILVDFGMWPYIFVGLGFFVVAYLVRSIIYWFVYNENLGKKDKNILQALCAKGLTPTVLLAVIGANSMFTNIVVGGIFSSILLTSIFVFLIERGWYTSIADMLFSKRKNVLQPPVVPP